MRFFFFIEVAEVDFVLSCLLDLGLTGLDLDEDLETWELGSDVDLPERGLPFVETLVGTFERTVRVGAMMGYAWRK